MFVVSEVSVVVEVLVFRRRCDGAGGGSQCRWWSEVELISKVLTSPDCKFDVRY